MFSVIIPWYRRPEIRQTLAANADAFARHSAEIVIVNCGDEPLECASLINDYAASINLRHILVPARRFTKSLAHNIGVFCSSGQLLFFLDADIVLASDVMREAAEILQEQRAFVLISRVRESHPESPAPSLSHPNMVLVREWTETREMVYCCPDGREARVQFVNRSDGSRAASGLVLVRRDDFLGAGGFNSAVTGWGFEDVDLQLRLQFAMELKPVVMGGVVHLTHGDDRRTITGSSRWEDHERNAALCIANYKESRYAGTYAADVAHWRDRIDEHPCQSRDLRPMGVNAGL